MARSGVPWAHAGRYATSQGEKSPTYTSAKPTKMSQRCTATLYLSGDRRDQRRIAHVSPQKPQSASP